MESASIRSKLHEYIDLADERKLEAMYVLLENDMDLENRYTASDIALLHERRNKHLNGSSQSYSISESLEKVRAQGK